MTNDNIGLMIFVMWNINDTNYQMWSVLLTSNDVKIAPLHIKF